MTDRFQNSNLKLVQIVVIMNVSAAVTIFAKTKKSVYTGLLLKNEQTFWNVNKNHNNCTSSGHSADNNISQIDILIRYGLIDRSES